MKPREIGIVFSGPMIRALLDGRKHQTRRIVKDAPADTIEAVPSLLASRGDLFDFRRHMQSPQGIRCPYGAAGDRLYVKEVWSPDATSVYPCPPCWFRADFTKHDDPAKRDLHERDCDGGKKPSGDCFVCAAERAGKFRWRSPLFMPRRYARIELEVESVRVERVQSITEDDARAEGVEPAPSHHGYPSGRAAMVHTHRAGFEKAWREINGDASWDASPWVWVVTFRRVKP